MKLRFTASIVAALACLLGLPAPQRCLAQTGVRDAIFQSALPLYADNSPAPLDPEITSTGAFPECTWQKVVYTGKTDRVPGLLFLPAGRSKPVACILLLHGLGGNKEQLIPLARFLASIGYASWAIDDVGSGERALPGHSFPSYSSLGDLTAGVTTETSTTIVDMRRGLDYLETRPEIDHRKFGLMGFSLGALLGGILGAVEPRLDAAILVSGGGDLGQILVGEAKTDVAFGKIYQSLLESADPNTLEQGLENIDPINFVGHISPRPLLMEHGRLDKIIPADTAEALFDAARQPKVIDWYPDAGHIPPPLELYPSISIFLDKYLPLPGR